MQITNWHYEAIYNIITIWMQKYYFMKIEDIKIEESWKKVLKEEFSKPYFDELKSKLVQEKSEGTIIYPLGSLIFNAYNSTPFDDVKVIIIGQDPYHNPGEAMGLSFSVPRGIRVPPSLKNIYKELHTDLGVDIADHGDLTSWANQGVLLLNAFLTVQHKNAGSHRKIGWGKFTDATIIALSEQRKNLVFMLWGNFAKSKSELINHKKHLVLEAAHPSPLARGAYFGSKHFSKCNEYLKKNDFKEINWKV